METSKDKTAVFWMSVKIIFKLATAPLAICWLLKKFGLDVRPGWLHVLFLYFCLKLMLFARIHIFFFPRTASVWSDDVGDEEIRRNIYSDFAWATVFMLSPLVVNHICLIFHWPLQSYCEALKISFALFWIL